VIDAKEFLRSGAGDDAARFQQNNARGHQQGLTEIVGNEDDGLAEAAGQSAEFTLELGARDRIERAKRLVHQQNRRIGGKGASHADPLTLASGKLARAPMGKFARIEADKLQHLIDAGGRASGIPILQIRNQGDIFRHREMRKQPRILNDVADAAAQANKVPPARCPALDKNFPFRGKQHPVHQPEEGGLAAAAAPKKYHGLATWDCQCDASDQRPRRNNVNVERHVPKFDHILEKIWRFRIHFD